MKITISALLLLSIIKITINNCIKGVNCPINQGTCIKNKCICGKLFATLPGKNSKITTYCNYEKINRFKPLILEFFFPSVGHFFAKKYILGSIKLSLIVIIAITFIYNSNQISHDDNSEQTSSNENEEIYKSNESEIEVENCDETKKLNPKITDSLENLHIANHEKKQIPLLTKFTVFLFNVCLIILSLIHINDLLGYGFATYRDGNKIPFY